MVQGIYYLATGIWPIISISTFMAVTGPKTDVWLVKMVGLLTCSIGVTILCSLKSISVTTLILAVGAAFSYLAIDVYYFVNGTVSKVYLADAAVEGILIVLLITLKRPVNS